jgi:hypothetical protein
MTDQSYHCTNLGGNSKMKKQYNVPTLNTFGSVAELTLAGSSGSVDEFRYNERRDEIEERDPGGTFCADDRPRDDPYYWDLCTS